MAQCPICSDEKARKVNVRLLRGGRIAVVSREFGFSYGTVRHHRRFCLPWRSAREPEPVTVEEQLAALKFELRRQTVLGEAGENIGPAIAALRERRNVLELEARMEHRLGATHNRLFPPTPPAAGDEFGVVFDNGRPRGVRLEKKAVSE